MSVLHRIVLPLVNSFIVTAALFGFMYSLIYVKEPELSVSKNFPVINFAYLPKEEDLQIITSKPEPPELMIERPESFRVVELDPAIIESEEWADRKFTPSEKLSLLPADNQLIIAIGFPPEYPSRAIARKIEGFAVVGFSVSAAGEVYDAYIQEAQPKGIFEKSALKAISKFKYRARTVGGKPVSTQGQRYMFTYKLEAE